MTLPDNNTIQTAYGGATVTVTDQVNRKMKRESDGLGRLIKVTEQDVASGTLNQETSYSYNYLDKLTGINQGKKIVNSEERTTIHYSLSRLRYSLDYFLATEKMVS